MANNKKLGTDFERNVVEQLSKMGYWVHFLTPNEAGAQPFDIIAVRDGTAYAFECKTLSDKRNVFSIDRLEENQIMAFEHWLRCGNTMPYIVIGHRKRIIYVPYIDLKKEEKIHVDMY